MIVLLIQYLHGNRPAAPNNFKKITGNYMRQYVQRVVADLYRPRCGAPRLLVRVKASDFWAVRHAMGGPQL